MVVIQRKVPVSDTLTVYSTRKNEGILFGNMWVYHFCLKTNRRANVFKSYLLSV